MSDPAPAGELRARVGALDWYHTLELAPGLETPGWFDTRSVAGEAPIPASLAGMRCLDVGSFDGFWAFEMERRGADEVVAIDLLDPLDWDWPKDSRLGTIEEIGRRKAGGSGFELAREAIGSSVERHDLSVYDLDPSEVGSFDFIYLGSLLIHLRDPVRAIERVRSVCSGTLGVLDHVDLELTIAHPRKPVAMLDGDGRPWWWHMNVAGLRRTVEAGGFEILEGPRRIYMPPGRGQPRTGLRPGLLASREGREALVLARRGDPHAALVARPRGGARGRSDS